MFTSLIAGQPHHQATVLFSKHNYPKTMLFVLLCSLLEGDGSCCPHRYHVNVYIARPYKLKIALIESGKAIRKLYAQLRKKTSASFCARAPKRTEMSTPLLSTPLLFNGEITCKIIFLRMNKTFTGILYS